MIIKLYSLFPFYILLIPVFYIWHLVNSLFGLVPVRYVLEYLGWYLLLGLTVFGIALLFLRNKIKSGVWSGVFLLVFFFWGSMHDWLRLQLGNSFFSSYKFLLGSLLLLMIFFSIRLKKKKQPPFRFHAFLLLLSFLFILAEMINTSLNLSNHLQEKNNLAVKQLDLKSASVNSLTTLPDIFIFTFDEYTSGPALEKYFGFSNIKLDSTLASSGFFIADSSKSNYNSTVHSLASFFNMQYLRGDLEGKDLQPLTVLQAQETISKSAAVRYMNGLGYKVINQGISNLPQAPSRHEPYFYAPLAGSLAFETLWGRIKKDILWNLMPPGPSSVTKIWALAQQSDSILAVMDKSLYELRSESASPRLLWSHVMITHYPYFFHSDGILRTPSSLNERIGPAADSLYLLQVKYCNTFIDSIISATRMVRTRPAVIILLGDHGKRDDIVKPETYDKQFMNLTAIYFPDKDYGPVSKNISPVNVLRIVMNKYFNQHLPVLKDSTILMKI
ncbi:MAG: hypothetical protein ABWZ25_05190 [Chitinophagaceae bacterium]